VRESRHPGGTLQSTRLSTSLGRLSAQKTPKSNIMQEGEEGLRLLVGHGDLWGCFLSRRLWRAPAVLEALHGHQSTWREVSL